MANGILATSSSLSNPVSGIAYLIATSLQERCDFSPEDHPYADYLRNLATLMGLGFTAILAEGNKIKSCKPHFVTFLRYHNFIEYPNELQRLSIAMAEIICTAIRPFQQLGFPLYYDNFVQALVCILKSYGTNDAGKEKDIRKMLQQLFEMCH